MTAPPADGVRWHERRTASGLTARVAEPAARTEPEQPPLLLLHGLAGGAWYWEPYQRFFAARGWPSYALNLRGHHGSRPVAQLGRVSLADYVEDALELAALLGRPPVIGHSLGGLLAQKLAEADAVAAAVLLCTMPPKGIRIGSAALAVRQLRHLGDMLLQRPLAGRPEDHEVLSLHRIPAAERSALARRFVADSGRVGRELTLGGLAVDPRRVRCPMLAISTREDRFFPPPIARKIAARYGIPLWEYPAHAHFVVMEPGWEVVAADIACWLEVSCEQRTAN